MSNASKGRLLVICGVFALACWFVATIPIRPADADQETFSTGGEFAEVDAAIQEYELFLQRDTVSPQQINGWLQEAGRLSGEGLPPEVGIMYQAELAGKARLSFYTTAPDENGGRTDGVGYFGGKLVPGYSIAVDPDYWDGGQLFFIEGYGIVRADDSGSAIKGQLRFDVCVGDKRLASDLGRQEKKIWVLKREA